MNWKLIFQLSLFGLFMGIATVYVIPSTIEPLFWLAIFLFCAYVIARNTSRRFLHGLCLGLANCVWITASHVALAKGYLASHAQEMAMMQSGPLAQHPRLMMAIVGPVIGVVSGCIIGLFALIAGKFVKTGAASESARAAAA
jgi:hypothetical protein